jgi:alpha-N-arabinofuranosidase
MIKSYQNPIIRGMHPDPSVVRVEDTYYLANSTFEYYPGVTVMTSKDLLNWQTMGGVAELPTQADLRKSKSNEGIFAANIRYHNGYFYIITTNFAEFKTFIIRGKLNPDGIIEWEKSRVEINVPGIDPDVYFENDRTYVQFTGYIDDKGTKAIRQIEIDLATGKILDGPRILTYGTGGRDVEGPHIFKKDGWYYLLVAEGGTGEGHMITIFRSKELWGSYKSTPTNPIFTNRDRANEPIQNVGHGDLFTDSNGNWWLVCLGTRPADVGFKQITNLGRETLLYPVEWENGWPIINKGVPTEEVNLVAFPKHAATLNSKQETHEFVDEFTEEKLRPEWLTLRDSLGEDLSVIDECLVLKGNKKSISDLATASFVGLRQTEHEEVFEVKINDKKSNLNDGSFGIASLIDAENHVALMVRAVDSGFDVYRDQQIADIKLNEKIGHLNKMPASFKLINTKETKIFSVDDGEKEVSFTTNAILLSNQAIAALNTGDIEGLYARNGAIMTISRVRRGKN